MQERVKELGEYLRAYRAYVSANLGWRKALLMMLGWVAGIFAPLIVSSYLFELPRWLAFGWMAGWSVFGYVFAPYGMWKHHRAQTKGDAGSRDSGV